MPTLMGEDVSVMSVQKEKESQKNSHSTIFLLFKVWVMSAVGMNVLD